MRLSYTMEQMGELERNRVVDQYDQKLLNSDILDGFDLCEH